MEQSDEELVQLVISKDQELYSEIVERYEAKLLRYARTFVYDQAAAADVVQNAFIKAFVNLNGFNPKMKFSSWIYRITHNEAINAIRKHKKEFQPENETWFDNVADNRDSVELELDKEFLAEELALALSQIEIKYREPLVLHIYENKSYKEISDIMKMPTASVGTRISRAKLLLRKILEKGEIDE